MTSAFSKIEEALLDSINTYDALNAIGNTKIKLTPLMQKQALELLRAHGNAVDVEGLKDAVEYYKMTTNMGEGETTPYARVLQSAQSYLAFITDGEK